MCLVCQIFFRGHHHPRIFGIYVVVGLVRSSAPPLADAATAGAAGMLHLKRRRCGLGLLFVCCTPERVQWLFAMEVMWAKTARSYARTRSEEGNDRDFVPVGFFTRMHYSSYLDFWFVRLSSITSNMLPDPCHMWLLFFTTKMDQQQQSLCFAVTAALLQEVEHNKLFTHNDFCLLVFLMTMRILQ